MNLPIINKDQDFKNQNLTIIERPLRKVYFNSYKLKAKLE